MNSRNTAAHTALDVDSRVRFDPRAWSVGARSLALLLLALLCSLPRAVLRLAAAWDAYATKRIYSSFALPRGASSLPAVGTSLRVRVSLDSVSLDMRPLMASLPPALREGIWDQTEALWRDALLVQSRDLIPLERGRLRREEAHLRRVELSERYAMICQAFGHPSPNNEITPETVTYFVDGRVPMATIRDLCFSVHASRLSFALRGPDGIVELALPTGSCRATPSVELDVTPSSMVLRSTTEVGGCTHGLEQHRTRSTVIPRVGPDLGISALYRALAVTPWSMRAPTTPDHFVSTRPDDLFAALTSEPVGRIAISCDRRAAASNLT